jgi:hypothetical protein
VDGGLQKMANDVLEVIRGISQVMANTYDGATDEDGKPIKIGLKREINGNINVESREGRMDGFKVKMVGNKLFINYQAEAPMRHIHKIGPRDYEKEVIQVYANIINYLKKEYKKIIGKNLRLSPDGEADILLQYMNKKRSWIECTQCYTIGGLGSVNNPEKEPYDLVRDFIKKSKYDG